MDRYRASNYNRQSWYRYECTSRGLLHILKNGGKGLLLGYYGNDIQGRYGSTGQNNGDLILNYWAGNVGVGTVSPSQKLHVNGDSYLQGKVYIGNTDTYLYRDAANRITTHDMFYVTSSSPATYLYSANTYLGGSSDKIHLRGNVFDWTSGGGGIINASGNVGIGTPSPNSKLHVHNGDIEVTSTVKRSTSIKLESSYETGGELGDVPAMIINGCDQFRIINGGSDLYMDMYVGGLDIKSGIAGYPESYIYPDRAKIDGKITCEELEIKPDVWADFVFTDSYNLRSLREVSGFIQENNHLPDVPSEQEVLEDGISVGKMNAILLQKIEELTLYIIEQDSRIEALESKENVSSLKYE